MRDWTDRLVTELHRLRPIFFVLAAASLIKPKRR